MNITIIYSSSYYLDVDSLRDRLQNTASPSESDDSNAPSGNATSNAVVNGGYSEVGLAEEEAIENMDRAMDGIRAHFEEQGLQAPELDLFREKLIAKMEDPTFDYTKIQYALDQLATQHQTEETQSDFGTRDATDVRGTPEETSVSRTPLMQDNSPANILVNTSLESTPLDSPIITPPDSPRVPTQLIA